MKNNREVVLFLLLAITILFIIFINNTAMIALGEKNLENNVISVGYLTIISLLLGFIQQLTFDRGKDTLPLNLWSIFHFFFAGEVFLISYLITKNYCFSFILALILSYSIEVFEYLFGYLGIAENWTKESYLNTITDLFLDTLGVITFLNITGY